MMSNQRVMRVRGAGHIAAEPDQVILTFEVEERGLDYEQCVLGLNRRVEFLRRELEESGVVRQSLKTTGFGVDTDYEWVNNRRVFRGYKARHNLILELPLERELLNRVVRNVAASKSEAELNISFGVRDETALKDRLLEEAVAAARRNAMILARAAEVTLGEIQEIDYSWTEVRFRSELRITEAISYCKIGGPDIEPEEIKAADEVTVVWEVR